MSAETRAPRIDDIPTLEPPRGFGHESESPLLQQEDVEGTPPDTQGSWVPFIAGVLIGLVFGKDILISVPFFVCGFQLFAVGLAFGGMLMVVLKLG
jgi:hypothetical protein